MLSSPLPLLTVALAWALPATASPIAGPGPNSLHAAQAAFNNPFPHLVHPDGLHLAHEPTTPPPSELAGTTGAQERYDGHAVWRVNWHDMGDTAKEGILTLLETLNIDIWHMSAASIDIRVPPALTYIRKVLPSFTTYVPDVQALVDMTARDVAEDEPEGGWNVSSIDTPFHDAYHKVEAVYAFGDALKAAFPDIVEEYDIGTTAEGRTIRAWRAHLKAADGEPEHEELEFVIQAGQHAREWVAPSASVYFLHSLVLDATADPNSHAANLLRHFTFTIVPIVNPDGFEYSHDHSRMWRKNRQDVGGLFCKGLDLNSNWGHKFKAGRTACSDSYAGREPFESLETKAMAYYLINGTITDTPPRDHKVRAFVDLHSYGQLFMFPYAYSCADFPPDAENLMEAGLGVAKAMRQAQNGEGYQTGQACDLTFRSTGEAIDYVYGTGDTRWSYSAELRDTGTYGFMLPASLIRPTGDEVNAGLRYLAQFIYETDIDKP
ncbi:hypothetical protein Q8F55_008282 [Vanrija albida]|uniref:Inactive metallocarboxypeptidase ECM14 n=1 Tax=Vanrija albida TaxID=181172 RepID=A0ABR3PW74_9TREE